MSHILDEDVFHIFFFFCFFDICFLELHVNFIALNLLITFSYPELSMTCTFYHSAHNCMIGGGKCTLLTCIINNND